MLEHSTEAAVTVSLYAMVALQSLHRYKLLGKSWKLPYNTAEQYVFCTGATCLSRLSGAAPIKYWPLVQFRQDHSSLYTQHINSISTLMRAINISFINSIRLIQLFLSCPICSFHFKVSSSIIPRKLTGVPALVDLPFRYNYNGGCKFSFLWNWMLNVLLRDNTNSLLEAQFATLFMATCSLRSNPG